MVSSIELCASCDIVFYKALWMDDFLIALLCLSPQLPTFSPFLILYIGVPPAKLEVMWVDGDADGDGENGK